MPLTHACAAAPLTARSRAPTIKVMPRALVLVALFLVLPCAVAGQAQSILHIKIVLGEVAGSAPVPRHVLLVSDNPSTSPPREVVTKADGTADVNLPPG